MEKFERRSEDQGRKEYRKPTLQLHGWVSELTRGGGPVSPTETDPEEVNNKCGGAC